MRTPSELSSAVDAYMVPLVMRGDASGVVAIAHGQEIVCQRQYGLANREWQIANTEDTRIMIGSISKQFTAVAMLVLQQQGRLHLDDLLARYISNFPGNELIRLRQLLNHASGISRDLPDLPANTARSRPLSEIVNLIASVPLISAPGTQTQYSNNAYRVAARVIEIVSGESYDRFMRRAVLQPAGLIDSGVLRNQDSVARLATGYCPWSGSDGLGPAPYAAACNTWGPGAIYTTAADLLRWTRVLATDGVLNTQNRGELMSPSDSGRGLGVSVYSQFGKRCIGHDGVWFGFNASLEWYPDDDVTALYLGNTETGSLDYVRTSLAAITHDQPVTPVPDRPVTVSVNASVLSALAGQYQVFPGFVLYVREDDGVLLLGAGESEFPLDPIGDDLFYYRLKYATVRFERVANGDAQALFWTEKDNTYRCQRIQTS